MSVDTTRHIVCLTSSYPHGKHETYFEIELQYLAKQFECVYIQPLYRPDKTVVQRKVPANVVVLHPLLPEGKWQRIVKGISNMSPVGQYVRDFFIQGVYTSRRRLQVWANAMLTFRISLAALQKFMRRQREDTLLYAYWASCALTFSSPSLRVYPKVVRVHGGDFYLDRNNGYLPVRTDIYHAASLMAPISDNISGVLTSHYKIDPAKIFISRLGIDNTNAGYRHLKQDNVIRIVSCSNLYALKRVTLIAEALMDIPPDVSLEWHHFGEGPELPDIMKIVRQFKENVKGIFHGWVNQEQLFEFYGHNFIDWFINVSKHEGIPVSIMEAFSFGIPAIATNVGGTAEIVNGANGYLLPASFDIAALRSLIIEKDPEYDVKRENAYRSWNEYFNAGRNFEQFIERLYYL